MNDKNYSGPGAAGHPRSYVPNWLDHTANATMNITSPNPTTAPQCEPGPNAVGQRSSTGTQTQVPGD